MKEGSLGAPIRHPLDWENPDFYNEDLLEAEMRRVFDICHGCRRCFNLCDSFPRLFELIDSSPTGELDTVSAEGFPAVVEACTLCDLCFMTKCPYVPPHEFNIDFPHMMLRHRAVDFKKGSLSFVDKELAKVDRNAKLASPMAAVANWALDTKNTHTRPLMEKYLKIDTRAALPTFHGKTFIRRAQETSPVLNQQAPALGRKAVLYATCLVNYHKPSIGMLARAILNHNGVETQVVYPECCGMPQLEQGNVTDVVKRAKNVATHLLPWIEKGYDVIALVPSCALMLKSEWPLLLPMDSDIKALKEATFDLSEYLVEIAQGPGLAPGLRPLKGDVTLHIACHARAQNMGKKAATLLNFIPDTKINVIERCSGHGGSWGVKKDNFDVALKVGRPVVRQTLEQDPMYISSECPLAATHIQQGLELQGKSFTDAMHPIELLAEAYGLTENL